MSDEHASTAPNSPAIAPTSLIIPVIVAAASGAFVAVQGNFNGAFTANGGGPLLAGWVSYIGTFLTVLIVMAIQRNVGKFFHILRTRSKAWWYIVGFGGVPIVVAMSWGIPLVGVAIASVCSVAGQTIISLIFDKRGVGIPAPIPFSGRRIAATLVTLAGLALAIGASSATSTTMWAMIATGIIIALAGAGLSVQNVGNGAVVARTGYPLLASLTSVIGGTALMSVILLIAGLTGGLDGAIFPPLSSWWMYMGGPVGAAIVFCSAWAIRRLGAFRLTLAVVAGQMVTSILVDLATGLTIPFATVAAAVTMVLATTLVVTSATPVHTVTGEVHFKED
ncbi:MAG: DMT family transporter [Ancrocorticia sp.]|uniref:DMT family transporter n=1 Tax=Ancrocorticia sp. TaxID=2593684 RepID=UPI003F8FEABC